MADNEFVLGLKGLTFRPSPVGEGVDLDGCRGTFGSPQQTWAPWPHDDLIIAKCGQHKKHTRSKFNISEDGCPGEGCSCGIWSTFETSIVMTYAGETDRAVFLIKGHPKFMLGTKGFRAAAAEVMAMVELPPLPILIQVAKRATHSNPFPDKGLTETMPALQHPTQNLIGALGCQYFGVGSITLDVALEAIRQANA